MSNRLPLIKTLKDLNLNLKINLILGFGLMLPLIIIVLVIFITNKNLTIQIGQQQIKQELNIIQKRFAELEQDLLLNVQVIAQDPKLAEAVVNNNVDKINAIVAIKTEPFIDDVDVFDKHGKRLIDQDDQHDELDDELDIEDNIHNENYFISLALLGVRFTGLVIETDEPPQLGAVTPLFNSKGDIVGGLFVSRQVDAVFLDQIDFGRDDMRIILIHDEMIMAHNLHQEQVSHIELKLLSNITFIQQTLTGQTIIIDELIYLDNEPYMVAYTPLIVNDNEEGVTLVLVNMQEMVNFRDALIIRIAAILAILGVLTLVTLTFFVWRNIVSPIKNLEQTAKQIALGNLQAQAMVKSNDEIGSLATTFNTMSIQLQKNVTLLETQRERLHVTLSSIGDAVITTDTQGKITFMNPVAETLTEWPYDEAIGQDIHKIFNIVNEETGQRAENPIDKVIADGLVVSLANHTALITKHGHEIPIADSGAPIKRPDGKLFGVVLVFHDIRKHRDFEQALIQAKMAEKANQAKSEFLANMSHELRTPLNGILGYAQILQRDSALSTKHHHAVNVIHQSGEHLLNLLNDILDISKVEAGRMELLITDFHLPAFLENIINMIRIWAKQKGLWFVYETFSDLPAGVQGDEKRLRQILINLLGNAVKFTQEGGVSLKVGYVEHDKNKIRFQVEDTGIGIKEADLQKIFQPFRQVSQERFATEGTGLGLSISHRLVKMMKSNLQVKSIYGKGTTFWFDLELPEIMVETSNQNQKLQTIIGYEGPPYKILVVDDKSHNRDVLINMLSPLGFEIFEAVDGEEGIEQAIEKQPDLIFMDLRLPLIDGYEVTKQLRQIPAFKDKIIIAISASVFEQNRAVLEAGCDDFLSKPVHLTTLLQTLQRHLNLIWCYADNDETITEEDSTDRIDMVVPPQTDLQFLFELAITGAVKEIQRYLDQIDTLDTKYRLFTKQIRGLAKAYKFDDIMDILEPLLDE